MVDYIDDYVNLVNQEVNDITKNFAKELIDEIKVIDEDPNKFIFNNNNIVRSIENVNVSSLSTLASSAYTRFALKENHEIRTKDDFINYLDEIISYFARHINDDYVSLEFKLYEKGKQENIFDSEKKLAKLAELSSLLGLKDFFSQAYSFVEGNNINLDNSEFNNLFFNIVPKFSQDFLNSYKESRMITMRSNKNLSNIGKSYLLSDNLWQEKSAYITKDALYNQNVDYVYHFYNFLKRTSEKEIEKQINLGKLYRPAA